MEKKNQSKYQEVFFCKLNYYAQRTVGCIKILNKCNRFFFSLKVHNYYDNVYSPFQFVLINLHQHRATNKIKIRDQYQKRIKKSAKELIPHIRRKQKHKKQAEYKENDRERERVCINNVQA